MFLIKMQYLDTSICQMSYFLFLLYFPFLKITSPISREDEQIPTLTSLK